jgi:aryl-alcohol dehydrogenase-like predicted oxidoreductase
MQGHNPLDWSAPMKIPRRKLGPQGLEVSAIGLACMGMSDSYGPSDEATNLRVLNAALDMGINLFDTADMYGIGANERLLGKVLKSRRAEVVLATKFGTVRGSDGTLLGIDGTPEYVLAACDASLERLGVDHIDLYFQHRVDPKVAIEETVGAMANLVKAGKVRYLGLSEASASSIRRAARVHPITALQSEFSLWARDLEATILPACEELNIGLVAHSPLGRDFLTGAVMEIVSQIAREQGYTPAQVALAWLLDCAPYIVPIPGTRNIKHLKENVLSVMVRLEDAELERLYGILRERLPTTPLPSARFLPTQISPIPCSANTPSDI